MIVNIFLTYYAIGCRFAGKQWPRELNELKGVLLTGLVQWLAVIAGCGWMQVFAKWPTLFELGRWPVMLVGLVLLTVNYVVIVRSGKGLAYVQDIEKVPAGVRLARYIVCLAVVIAIVALIILSIIAYRRTFGVPV